MSVSERTKQQQLIDVIMDAKVSCAMRGLLKPGEYLEPQHWETVRRRLQATYRRATGEVDAVLLVRGADKP